MKTRTRTRWSRTATLAAAGALAVGLLPTLAPAATAGPASPSFGYLTYGGSGVHDATTDKLVATAPGDLTALTSLTPSSYAYAYDLSEDGSALLVSGQSRPLTTGPLNTTYGLLLVRNVAGAVTTTSLATLFDANPVLSPSGAKAYWMDSGVLYSYDVASGVTSKASTRFAPAAGETVSRIAISPDGTRLAAMYTTRSSTGALTRTRLKAAALASNVGAVYEDAVTVGTGPYPTATVLVWSADSASVAYARSTGPGTTQTVVATPGVSAAVVDALADVYDVELHLGTWYMFKDVAGGSQFGTSTSLTTAPTSWTDVPQGASSVRYLPATVTPPAVTTPVNRAAATSSVFLSKSIVTTGQKVLYATLASYLTDGTGSRPSTTKVQTRYGILRTSTDAAKTFKNPVRTGATKLITWPTGSPFGNGYSAALTRNTWFQWCFGGDVFVTADCSTTKKVTVKPTVSVAVAKLGTQKRVYGVAKRIGGTAVLYRYVSGAWKPIKSTTITSTGKFSFGFRVMAKGSWKVTTKADTYWGSGLKQLTI